MKETTVALSGTLETFSLPDVLRLLSSTKKTGRLALDGDRGRGRIWVRDGAIVAAEADRAVEEQVEGVAFELLRFTEAMFEFESGAEPTTDGTSHEVDDVLAEAELRLIEWREIESVVPSLDVWVRMVDELDVERIVTPGQWRVLARIGAGSDGHALADRLGQGEYDVCRQLRDLVVDGMVEVAEVPVEAPAPQLHIDVDAAWDAPVEPADELVEQPDDAPSALEAMVDTGAEPSWDAVEPMAEAELAHVEDEAEDDDLLSQLSQLSPKAAAAVEATWSGEVTVPAGDEEPEAAEAAATEHVEAPAPAAGDDIDQNLLLRFLSSAKS